MTAAAVASPSIEEGLVRAWGPKRGLPGFLSSVNHKQIGLRFIWTAVAFLVIGGFEGLLLRMQLSGSGATVLSPEAYNQLFTMHGTTMMFLFAVPVLEGLAMYLVPLQLGTRDLPFPRLNAFGYWLYLGGGLLLNSSFLTGSVPDGGWFAYTPLTNPEYTPDRSMDFWLLGVTLVEISGIIGAIELITLVLRFRAPGMSLGRIPVFSWSVLAMAAMMLIAFPFVVVASTLLELERKLGAPFYDPTGGGDPLLWQHLFWIFGHPEVYIMLLPATGIISAVVVAHVQRPIVAYPLVVASLIGIAVVSFGIWAHHMFAVGLPVLVLSVFAVASYFIAVPSGIQVFAWIATAWEGSPRWRSPLLFAGGFLFLFVLGGITGVMVATVPFDLQAHDSFFVVAHFHYVIIGGVVFPVLAGLLHWFPKLTGRLAREGAARWSFWLMLIGFNVTFFPQHWLGLQGMPRRVSTYDAAFGWDAWNLVSTIGAFVLAAGIALYFANLAWSWRWGAASGPDPWAADSLEWATASPPPVFNFRDPPTVGSLSPLWDDAPAELDGESAQAVQVIGRPWRDRREIIRTSTLDGRPEQIVAIPGPSYWPAVSALCLTATMVGVLMDWWVLAVAGLATTLGSLLAWNQSNRAAIDEGLERIVESDDLPAPDDLELGGRQRRWANRVLATGAATEWRTAMVLTLIAIATIASALLFAYVYLAVDGEAWPPPDAGLLSFEGWLAASVAVALAVVVARTTHAGKVRLLASAAVLCGAAVLQVLIIQDSGLSFERHAYDAITLALAWFSLLLLGTAVLVRGVVTAIAWRAAPVRPTIHDTDATFVPGAALLWFLTWLTLQLGPMS